MVRLSTEVEKQPHGMVAKYTTPGTITFFHQNSVPPEYDEEKSVGLTLEERQLGIRTQLRMEWQLNHNTPTCCRLCAGISFLGIVLGGLLFYFGWFAPEVPVFQDLSTDLAVQSAKMNWELTANVTKQTGNATAVPDTYYLRTSIIFVFKGPPTQVRKTIAHRTDRVLQLSAVDDTGASVLISSKVEGDFFEVLLAVWSTEEEEISVTVTYLLVDALCSSGATNIGFTPLWSAHWMYSVEFRTYFSFKFPEGTAVTPGSEIVDHFSKPGEYTASAEPYVPFCISWTGNATKLGAAGSCSECTYEMQDPHWKYILMVAGLDIAAVFFVGGVLGTCFCCLRRRASIAID